MATDNRTLTAARVLLVNSLILLGLPVVIALGVLGLNAVLFAAVLPETGGETVTGALVAIYIATAISHVQTMSQMFPFSLGISITRRDFLFGAGLVITGQALVYGTMLWGLALLERATGGWGLNLGMFDLEFLQTGNPVTQILVYAAPLLTVSFFGTWSGIVYHRWGTLGVWIWMLGLAALIVGAAPAITWLDWWPVIGSFFTDTTPLMLFGVYPAVIAALLATATYVTSRRAVV